MQEILNFLFYTDKKKGRQKGILTMLKFLRNEKIDEKLNQTVDVNEDETRDSFQY